MAIAPRYQPPKPAPPEYNPRGDSYNGSTGAVTPGAITNQNQFKSAAASTGRTGSATPFEGMLNHALAFNQAMGRVPPPAAPPPPSRQVGGGNAPAPSTEPVKFGPPGGGGIKPGGGGQMPAPTRQAPGPDMAHGGMYAGKTSAPTGPAGGNEFRPDTTTGIATSQPARFPVPPGEGIDTSHPATMPADGWGIEHPQGGSLRVGREGGGYAPPPGWMPNPNQARRDQTDNGGGATAPTTTPTPNPNPAPAPPPNTRPPGTIPFDPTTAPTTPATIPGIGGAGDGLTPGGPPGGQIGGTVPGAPPDATRGNGGGITSAGGPPTNQVTPAGWGPRETEKLNQYIADGYGFLKDHPDWLAGYWTERYQGAGVDIADYLAGQHPGAIDWSQVPENARPGRKGYDTWRFSDANGTPRGFELQSGIPNNGGNVRGLDPSQWGAQAGGPGTGPYGTDRAIQGQADALAEEARKKAAAAAANPPPKASAPISPMEGGGGITASPVDPTGSGAIKVPGVPGGPPGLEPVPGANPTPGVTRGGGSAPIGKGTTTPGALPPSGDAVSQMRSLLGNQFGMERDDLARQMNAQAVLTGDVNAGTYNDAKFGRAQAQLVGEQGKRLTDAAVAANESGQQRMLQKYIAEMGNTTEQQKIEADRFAAQLTADVTREGIKTNADLERWVKQHEFDLQQKGIDANLFIEQYKADSAKEEGKYAADAGVNAARLQAGATRSAAGASASAAHFAAQLQQQLGIVNADVDRERNLMQFILGMGGLSNDALRNLMGMSPDQFIGGNAVPPGTIVAQP